MPQTSPADRVLAQIPPADQVILADFFKRFLLGGDHPFGFTLFGNKPMTLGPLYRFDFQTNTENPSPELIQQSLTFLKYQPLLGNTNFVIKIVKPFYKTTRSDVYDLMMLNKTACLSVLGKNLSLFQQRFGPIANPQSILKRLEATDDPKALLGHQELIGILFGFGTANSQAYNRYTQLVQWESNPKVPINAPTPLNEVWVPLGSKHKIRYLAKPDALPGPGFQTAQAELDQLVQVFPGWPPDNARKNSPIQAPIFRNLNNHPESRALTQSYLMQQAYIEQIYHRRDLLKQVIQQLLQPAPTAVQPAATLATRHWVA